jgi:SAM-dependent methyltransferase
MVEGHHPSVERYVTSRRMAARYDMTFASTALFATDTRFMDEVLPPPPAKVVDLGCGTGRHVVHLARRGYEVTGVDLSEHMLAQARSKVEAEGLPARLVRGDICSLGELASGAFDGAVCMFSTLGLLKGRKLRLAALAEARRLLRPGGAYVFHVHNRLHNLTHSEGRRWLVRNAVAAALGRAELGDRLMIGYRGEMDLYLHVFSRREAVGLAREAGVEVTRVMALNERRDGELAGGWRSVAANGFLISAQRV